MNDIKDGGPAFPMLYREFDNDHGEHVYKQTDGVSVRDYFAAKALPGIYERTCKMLEENCEHVTNVYDIAAIAAYEQADAMLRAREAS